MPEWLSRGLVFAALLVVLGMVTYALGLAGTLPVVLLAFGWGLIDGRADARAHPDPGRRGHLATRWLLAGLVAALLSGAALLLISLARGVFWGLMIESFVFTALEVFLVAFLGVAVGRWLAGSVPVSDAVPDIKSVIVPLRLIFWGSLIVLIDLTYSKTVNGVGWRFDFLNDAVGMLMILWATSRLAKIRVNDAYRTALLFVTITAFLSLLDAIHSHFIYDTPPAVTLLSALVGVASMIAMVVFCVAMRWLIEAAGLARAARSWKITTWLMVIIYLIPIGALSAAAAVAIAMGTPFNIDLGPKGLLLVPVFCIPLVHFFVSTRRMTAEAESPAPQPLPQPPQVDHEPGRTGKRLLVPILVIASVLAVAGLFTLLHYRSPSAVAVGGGPLGVAVDPGTRTIYVANGFDDTMSVIDGKTNTVTATVAVGDYPHGVAVDPGTHTVYVTNTDADTVSVIDGTTNTVTATVAVGKYPRKVAVDPGTHTVYVSNGNGGTVSVIDGTTDTVTATVAVDGNPNGVAVDPDTHNVYVAKYYEGTVSVIDGKTHAVTATVAVDGSPNGVAVDPGTHTVYFTNDVFTNGVHATTVSVIDGSTNTVTAAVDVGHPGDEIHGDPLAVDPGTHTVYVSNGSAGTVSVVDGSTHAVSTVDVGTWPSGVAVDPGTHNVYVTDSIDDTVTVIEPRDRRTPQPRHATALSRVDMTISRPPFTPVGAK